MAKQIVGVAGGTSSGKTTICNLVVKNLKMAGKSVSIIHLDQFFILETGRGHDIATSNGDVLPDCNDPSVIDQSACLASLHAAESDCEYLIVEGHLLFCCEALVPSFSKNVFVDAPADVRFIRRLLRDLERQKFGGSPQLIAEYYLESARPGHEKFIEPSKGMADLVLDGQVPPEENAIRLMNFCRECE